MKRYSVLAMLMLLSPSAYADSISFSVGGRRIHIEAPRYCRSPSCASVSISGGYRSRGRYDDDDRYEDNAPVKPQPAPATQTNTPPAAKPPAPPVVVASPPAAYRPAAATTQIVAAPPPPAQPPPVAPALLAVPPAPPPPVAKPIEPVRPAPQIARVSHDTEADADTPLGDWQTEGKAVELKNAVKGTAPAPAPLALKPVAKPLPKGVPDPVPKPKPVAVGKDGQDTGLRYYLTSEIVLLTWVPEWTVLNAGYKCRR